MRLGSSAPFPVPFPRLMSALPDFVLAGAFALAWTRPQWLDPAMLRVLHMTMLVEFLVVHASGFLGVTITGAAVPATGMLTRLGRGTMLLALAGFYTLFALGFSFGMRSWFPLVSFWSLMLNRMLPLALLPRERIDTGALMGLWAAGVASYLFGVFITTVPPLPRLGMDAAAVASLELSGGGLWIDEPWRVMAFGLVYFTLMGLVQLAVFGRRLEAAEAGRARPRR